MADYSDSDSSPKAPSSSRSRGSSGGEEERAPLRPAEDDPNARADPESPSNAHQSSDESGSSDGVLVELPGNPDQDSRGVRDADSGILVNIDGSMQEPQDDGGKEETFEDAPDHLGMAGERSSGLEESMAVIEIGERSGGTSDNVAKLQSRLDDALTECRKYQEEREIFGLDIFSLQQHLQHIITATCKEELLNNPEISEGEERTFPSRTPLHSTLNDCNRFILDLKGILVERFDYKDKISQLQTNLYAKDQEIEYISSKTSESSISYDVIISYLDSLRDSWAESVIESSDSVAKRLLSSLAPLIGEEYASLEGSGANGMFLVEKNTSLLVEKHIHLLSEIHQLGQCLMDVRPEFATLEGHETGNILGAASEELSGRKIKEAYLQEKIEILEEENKKLSEQIITMTESLGVANAETNKIKAELQQAESKFIAAKEKLSIAVSKGKSLVQHRDSLKQSLTEKTSELERCMQELQQKSEVLQSTENHLEELKERLSEKTSELEKCFEDIQQKADALEAARKTANEIDEFQILVGSLQDSLLQKDTVLRDIEEVLSHTDIPQEVVSLDIIDKARWFVNQKNVADIILLENQKTREAMSSIEFPGHVSLDSQIEWLVSSFSQAKHETNMLQDEINGARLALLSHESQLHDAQKEIDMLKSSLMGEKHEKDSLQGELDELKRKQEGLNEKMSLISSEKDGLLKVLVEMSESTLDDLSLDDTSAIVEKCVVKLREKTLASPVDIEKFETLQSLLYLRDQDLRLCQMILEEEIIDQSSMNRLSEELAKVSDVVVSLQNDNDSMKKELERAEEKSSLLREKLSLAVKKGKGLVQEREGFKISLDEKASEITKLKQDLQLKDSKIAEYQERIEDLSILPEHIQKLESEIVTLKDQRDQKDSRIAECQERIESLSILPEHIQKLESEIVILKDQRYQMDSKIAEYKERIESLSILPEHVQKLESEIVTLNDQRDRKDSKIAEYQERIESLSILPEYIQKLESEIVTLKDQRDKKDSKIAEYQERIESLSILPEHIQNLESEIVTLKDQRDHGDKILHEFKSTLQSLIDSLEKINLPADFIFEGPLEKVNWISDHIKKSELARMHAIEELKKVEEEARSFSNKLDDAFTTIKSLEEDLSKAQEHISSASIEMAGLQASKTSIEQELEKITNEKSLQSDKITDAFSTIKSLEDALLEAERNFSLLNNEKDQANAEIRKENSELTARLAECMEDLAGSRNNIENYRAEINSQLEYMLLKDDSLLSKVCENLIQKVEALQNMGLLIQNMHDEIVSKGLCLHLSMEHEPLFTKLSSLPNAEEIVGNLSANIKTRLADYDDISSFALIAEGLHDQAKILLNKIDDSSRYLDDYITGVSEAFKATRDELLHVLKLNESLKLHVETLEAHNRAQEAKTASLQRDMMILSSACVDATQELLIESSNLRDISTFERDVFDSTQDLRSNKDSSAKTVESVSSEYTKSAERLLLVSRGIGSQCKQLANAEKVYLTSIEEMKTRLQEAEFSAKDAIQARKLGQEKISALEKDLEALKDVCHEMKAEKENYQIREVMQGKEEQASSIGMDTKVLSKREMEILIDKVNQIPLTETEMDFPTPVEKLIYIVGKVADLIDEKENMQSTLSSLLRQIEYMKNVAETTDANYEELQSKKTELSDVTLGLERVIQKLGGFDLVQDQKSFTAKTLLEILERVATATSLDFENCKFKIQELGAKLEEKDKVINKWSMRFKMLEDSIQERASQQDVTKDRAVIEATLAASGSEISQIEDGGTLGKNSISSVSNAPHVRTMRKGSSDHLVLNIDSESERLISPEIDDKGHIFKSLNASGLIPKQGKAFADKVDGLWVSGGRLLMHRPGARLGLIAYWIFLHLWLLGAIA